ncbi:MAG: universal stress protein [Bacteroidia bacterium]
METFEVKKILVPVDFSATGEKVLNQAIMLAKKTRAEIVLITILESPLGSPGKNSFGLSVFNSARFEGMIADGAKKNMEKYKTALRKKGVAKVSYLIESGKPYKKITDVAKRIKADIIMMGTHGVTGVSEFVMGSNTFRVVSNAQCPVISIQKSTKKAGFKNVLLPFRDKPHSRESVEYAMRIAEIYGAAIHVLGISFDPSDEGIRKIKLEGEQIRKILDKHGVKNSLEIVKGNYVARLILDYSKKKKADLLVIMADLDKMSISEYVIGPVVQQLINHSPIPVLSIRPVFNPAALEAGPANASDWSFWG